MSEHMERAIRAAAAADEIGPANAEPNYKAILRAALPHLVEELIGRSQEWGSCSIEHLRAAARRIAEGQ